MENFIEIEYKCAFPFPHNSIYTLHYFIPNTPTLLLYDTRTKEVSKHTLKDPPSASARYFSSINVQDRIILCGGYKGLSSYSNATFEFRISNSSFFQKAQMVNPKYKHALVDFRNTLVYSVGGTADGTYNSCNYCEKYDIIDNKWEKAPYLNEKKVCVCAVNYNDMFIFTFGGTCQNGVTAAIEKFNTLKEQNGWSFVTLKRADGWTAREGCISMQVNNTDVILFGGSKNESFSFDCEETLKKHSALLNVTKVYDCSQPPIIYSSMVYAIGDDQHIHIYSVLSGKWNIVPKQEWIPT